MCSDLPNRNTSPMTFLTQKFISAIIVFLEATGQMVARKGDRVFMSIIVMHIP